jgi:hypothetical protein
VIDTFQALAVLVLAILPGASYTFTFERVAGSFGQNLADRLIRFVAASAVLQALFSGVTYVLYQRWVLSGRVARGQLEWYWSGLPQRPMSSSQLCWDCSWELAVSAVGSGRCG